MNIIDGKSYEEAIEYINSLSQFVAETGCERAGKTSGKARQSTG